MLTYKAYSSDVSYLNRFAIHLKWIYHCNSTLLQKRRSSISILKRENVKKKKKERKMRHREMTPSALDLRNSTGAEMRLVTPGPLATSSHILTIMMTFPKLQSSFLIFTTILQPWTIIYFVFYIKLACFYMLNNLF